MNRLKRFSYFAVLSLALMAATTQGRAEISVGISIGGPPPPPPAIVEHPWASPGYGAVWVQPHYEWRDHWVWIHGYYEYPPHEHMHYYPAHYDNRDGNHRWFPGGWR